ncbi:MAG: capsular polysaccharide biosynthesis protein [Halioglobus sp.]|jgi:capsular polysaccharide biosynthesis protein
MSPEVHRGEDGWLFLTGGEHQIIDLFREESAFTQDMANAWIFLLRLRADLLNARGIQYIHLAVPDKLTLLNRHYADTLQNADGSPIRQLHLRHEADLPNFLNVVPFLTQGIDKYPIFWKTDSHWTAWGCYMAYQLLCSRLHIPTNTDILNYPYTEAEMVLGLGRSDVASASGVAQSENIRTYHLDRHSKRTYANEVVRYRENLDLDGFSQRLLDASNGGDAEAMSNLSAAMAEGHGSHVIYENHSATAADKKIVLFGDSFSDYRQNLLTAMLAETVKEVHFVWSHSVDHEYVRQVRPDIVISQNSEASMTVIPIDSGDVRSWADNRLASLENAISEASTHGQGFRTKNQPGMRTRRTDMLESETYHLDPPIMVQPDCDMAHQDMVMQTNPVSLVELDRSRLFFRGDKCFLRAANGHKILSYGLADHEEEDLLRQEYQPLSGTSFLLAPTGGAHCYYHWMLDILPKLGLLERQGVSLDSIDHFLVRKITGEFQRETLRKLGIDESRIVETVDQQFLQCDRLLHVDMNTGINLKMHRFVPLWLKQTFLTQAPESERLKLYISRPEGIRRGILNEAEIKPLVEAAGFTVVAMEGMSVTEQAALLSRADALMAPHGGALTNMVFCKPGIPVIELMSRHVYPYYYGLSGLCSHRYHAIMEDPAADYPRLVNHRIAQAHADPELQWRTQNESFSVDLGAIEQMLEKLATRI